MITGRSVTLSVITGRSDTLSVITGRSVILSVITGWSVTLSVITGRSVILSVITGTVVTLSVITGRSVTLSLSYLICDFRYEDSDWGWKDKDKYTEMTEERAQYLIAFDVPTGKPMAFTHFRFDMELDDEVVYW